MKDGLHQQLVNAICRKYESQPLSAEDWSFDGRASPVAAGDKGGYWVPVNVHVSHEDIKAAEDDPVPKFLFEEFREKLHSVLKMARSAHLKGQTLSCEDVLEQLEPLAAALQTSE